MLRRALFLALLALGLPLPLEAQNWLRRADSLFRSGHVFAAESLYYAAVRRRPRDPESRLALGRYLAARGALKVGAVLMEEARFFGGDPKTVATYLVPVYTMLGDYKALAALPASPLSPGYRARAEYLRRNPQAVTGPATTVVGYQPDTSGVGSITVMVAGQPLHATIDPTVQGVVLDSSWIRQAGVRTFPSTYDTDWRNSAAVIRSFGVGALTLTNVPARFEDLGSGRVVKVGLDLLGQFVPSFNPVARNITLHRSAKTVSRSLAKAQGEHLPTLTYGGGVWLVLRDGVWPLNSVGARYALNGRQWTLNPPQGEILVAR